MKRIYLSLIAMAATFFGMSAITIDEAYEQIIALPGVAVSEMPSHDVLKEGMDWGKVAMFIMVPDATLTGVEDILAQVTDPVAVDKKAVDQSTGVAANPVKCYTQATEDGRTKALMTVFMPARKSCVVQFCQGGDDVVEKLDIQ